MEWWTAMMWGGLSVMCASACPDLGTIAPADPGVRSRCVCEGVCGCETSTAYATALSPAAPARGGHGPWPAGSTR